MNTNKNTRNTNFSIKKIVIKNLKFNLHDLRYLPRWIIILIDGLVLMIAFIVTHFLFKGTDLDYIVKTDGSRFIIIFFSVNIFFFWVFKSYSGIIRHSSYIDAVKLFFSQTSALLFFITFNFAFELIYGHKAFSNITLFVYNTIAFCGLFLYRIVVKHVFDFYFLKKESEKLTKIFIFGTDANAIFVANALIIEEPLRFKIVGFLDKTDQNSNKRMLDLPIFSQSKGISVLLKAAHAEGIILADKSLSVVEKIAIVDECLEFNYKIYSLPFLLNWENKKEISQNIKKIQIDDLLERLPITLNDASVSNQLEGKTILITGAAGSIGSEIVKQILKYNPKQIVVLDQAETPLHELGLEIKSLNSAMIVHAIVADVRNKGIMNSVFMAYKPQLIFHAAAYKHVPMMEDNPSQAVLNNVDATKKLADLACKYNVEKFIMISTDKAVNPSNIMGASKRIAEKYVQSLQYKYQRENEKFHTKFITTRFGNVLGSNGSVVPLFSKQIAQGGPVTLTHPDIIRYFMTITEACQLVLEASIMGNGGEIYIFDMGHPVKIIDLAKKMIKLAGFIPEKEIKIEITGLRPGEKLYEELLNDNSKTIATHHPKIMIAQEIIDEYETLHLEIEELIKISGFFNNKNIVTKMKKIVPEFISKNSSFEILDN